MAFGEQGPERQRLGRRPVEALARVEHRLLGVDHALQRLVDLHALGNGGQHFADTAQLVFRNRRRDIAAAEHRLARQLEPAPAPFEPVRLVRQIARSCLKLLFQMGDVGLGVLLDPGAVDDAFLDQPLRIDFGNRRVLADRRIHLRLGEARLVALVVAEPAVAPHVDDDVAAEGLAELDRQLASRRSPLPDRRR